MANETIEISADNTVGALVTTYPAFSRVFEEVGIDYCCGGKQTLQAACREKGIDPEEFIARLKTARTPERDGIEVDVTAMSLTELTDHIVQTHHVFLRSELPRLDAMTEKVANKHADRDPRLRKVRSTFLGLAGELTNHMMKEEQILFPVVRQMDTGKDSPAFHCGSVEGPIQQMEHEHDQAGLALDQLRELTDGYQAPDWSCNTYRAVLDALSHLERDLHQHIHKENNVLFPRVMGMENQE